MSNIPHEKGPESSSPALSATPEQVRELAVAHRRVVFAVFLRPADLSGIPPLKDYLWRLKRERIPNGKHR